MANIDEIKQAVPIEDLVREAGHDLVGRGRYLKSRQHDSLVVDTQLQAFFWNSEGKQGDVITWVMDWKRVDFKGAVEYLCRISGQPEPEWTHGDQVQRLAARAKEDALTVACRRFAYQLWLDGTALAYARGRGWTDETIKAAGLGYTGEHSAEEVAELRAALTASDVDLESPGAVVFLGYQGDDLNAWMDRQKLKEIPTEWLTAKGLPAIWKRMLVYPHVVGGRVVYVSLRSIDPNVDPKNKSKNLNSALVGPRRPYFNHVYGPGEESVVLVEGQADAITLAQWGIPAVALCGLALNPELVKQLQKHKHVYLALDKDRPGQLKAAPLAKTLGPLTRLVEWPAHDANEWLQGLVKGGLTKVEDQASQALFVLNAAKPIVKVMAEEAGRSEGAKHDDAVKATMEVIAVLSERDQALYRSELAKLMGLTKQDFSHLLGQVSKEMGVQAEGDEEGGIQETVGGWIDGWLVELLYDAEKKMTFFAYRNPEGKIGTAVQLDIGGITYKPKAPDDLIKQGVVVLPSAIGPELREKELIDRVVDLIHRNYLIDAFYEKLAAYYVLFSWSFDSFRNLVYLRMLGEYGSGKTELMQIIGYCCRRLILLSGVASDAALFRTMHIYKGTLFIDEGDKAFSDTDSPYVKILNTGDRRGFPVVRMREAGQGRYEPEAYDVFCPKLLTTRKRFDDDALESRCLTIETIKHSTHELVSRNIPIHLNKQFYEEASELRNALLQWRLRSWQPDVEIDPSLVDPMIQARLNQVMMPILQIVKDLKVRGEIQELVRRYQQRMTTEKSMMLDAKVLQAIIQIHESPPITLGENGKPCTPYFDLSCGNIAKVANAIIDEENADGEEAEAQSGSSDAKKLKPKGVGSIVNKRLNLTTEQHTSGPLKRKYVLAWDEERIKGLRAEYGV